ncbi:DUF1349 domain-containing protein [Fictibacillus fluitans]|uniref:DUF1349 domain-containing protein n=1 Tax=Fictibacillus fluitans TaxID=3058422 RepID=A0ABT8I077_9BACL|nr:DUF1349 domain-containing protein [Fictibacillus sp. NE201]MDN4526405.1 DUF1349 domain-containing protein [Fictibacillus sp. NE201]
MWEDYTWMNEPAHIDAKEDSFTFITNGDTDFWRNTYYQFNRMTGHALLKDVSSGHFQCSGTFRMNPKNTYDQVGILIYVDEDTWIKCSVEYIPEGPSHLGAVVTSYGYSDWSSQDYSNLHISDEIKFEVTCNSNDVEIYFIHESGKKEQIRIAHLHTPKGTESIKVGPYACSPNELNEGFKAEVLSWSLV